MYQPLGEVSPIRVFMLPIRLSGNKYMDLLVDSLRRSGLAVEPINKRNLGKPGRGDVVHLHWPSFLYSGRNAAATTAKTAFFLFFLLYLKARGIRIVWTVHNVWPHSGGATRYHRTMRTILCAFCSRIIVMGEASKQEVVRLFRAKPSKLVQIPHGHYKEAYSLSGIDIRQRYGIPQGAYLFLFVGRLSPYKGLDLLLSSFAAMADENTHLLVAGEPSDGFDASKLSGMGSNLHVSLGFVKDEELADYVAASDAVVLPYRNITTSGTAILALSFNRPVVAPDIGLLRDYLNSDVSILYDPSEPDGLIRAMREMREGGARFRDPKGYEAKLRDLDWTRISSLTSRAYSENG